MKYLIILLLIATPLSIQAQCTEILRGQLVDDVATLEDDAAIWVDDVETVQTVECPKLPVVFRVYPSPATDLIIVESDDLEIDIFNAIGQLQYRGPIGRIEVGRWAQGWYIVHNQLTKQTVKFIKI